MSNALSPHDMNKDDTALIPNHIPYTSFVWIYLGIFALSISGVYSIFLVILRAPILNNFFANKEVFRTILVIHVNLSVLVWMLSSITALWCISISKKYNYWVRYSNYVAWIGIILMTISPLIGDSNPVLNNYVPMLENWCFIAGLTMFCVTLLIPLLCTLLSLKGTLLCYANCSTCILVLVSYVCFVMSYCSLQKLLYPLDLHFFYETLFWSGGHILQFVFTEGAMIVWLLLIEQSSGRRLHHSTTYVAILLFNIFLALPAFWPHFAYTIDSMEFTNFFTLHMKYCGGIAPTLLLMMCFLDFVSSSTSSPWIKTQHFSYDSLLRRCLTASLFLFFVGGCIGLMIGGVNVTIPAHYHGSIVGISIAFMGLGYHMLRSSQYTSGILSKQPYIYAIGQLTHIMGLALSGGYGVLRKTPGVELSFFAKITMGIMGFGGFVAIIGGLLFVWICTMSLRK